MPVTIGWPAKGRREERIEMKHKYSVQSAIARVIRGGGKIEERKVERLENGEIVEKTLKYVYAKNVGIGTWGAVDFLAKNGFIVA